MVIFWGFKILNIIKFFSEKSWRMKILWIFFGVVTKLDYIKGSFLCILVLLLRSRYRMGAQNGDVFGVGEISIIF